MTVSWRTWAVLVGVLVLVAVTWRVVGRHPEPQPFTKPVAVDGRDLRVTYTGSECQDGSRLDIEEEPDRVLLTVYTWSDAGSCNDVGVPYVLSGRLSSDLGDRALVDGACELPKFRTYGDCRPS